MASLVMRSAAFLLACISLLVHSHNRPAQAVSAGALCPNCNVVLISVDTLRADHVGCYGYERPTTPSIDDFSRNAVIFERAISQAPWTLPAHGAMFSGLYPGRLGVTSYPAVRKLPDGNAVLPEELRKAGYATAGFTGGGFVSAHYGFDRGFDTYTTSGRRFEYNVRQSLDWLGINKDRRFFLFLHGYDAHRPYYSTDADKKAMGLADDLPVERLRYCFREERDRPSDEGLAEIIAYYDAAIRHGDRELGPFFDRLKQLGLMENTIIIVTSDHGEEFFEHGNCDHVRFVYEESVHVPLIIYVPGHSPNGKRVPGLVPASISIARTALDLVGLQHSMPGVSLVPILTGERDSFPIVYSQADSTAGALGSRGEVVAATRRHDKLVSYMEEGASEGFDLIKDPREQKVLDEDAKAYRMRNTLRAWAASNDPLPKPKTTSTKMTPKQIAEREKRRERRLELLAERIREEPALGEKRRATRKPSPPLPRESDDPPKKSDAEFDGDPEAEPSIEVPDHVRESLKALGYIEE
ncbi:MAG: arylsulfatase A-like enzyme [Hyphomicrobiaceae bacterium]|jgi:arylsulfatase A-like enzyme